LKSCRKSKIFSPLKGLRNRGRQQTSYLTVNGRVQVERTVYKDKDGRTVVPCDKLLGIDNDSYSPGVREMCCRESLCCSFRSGSDNLKRLAQLEISSTTIAKIAFDQGDKISLQQSKGEVKADFTSDDCLDGTVITGADGVMVPLVTEEQKYKRRQTEKAKRIKEGRKSTASRGRPKKGSDGAYKESKVVAFYSKDKKHQYAVSTCGNHEKLGSIMRREGFRIGIDKAASKYSITDGASWIQKQYNIQLPMLDVNILDYFHLKEHVKEVGNILYGESTPQSIAWREDIMSVVWNQGSLVMLDKLGECLKKLRSPVKKKALESLRKYVGCRIDMTDYPTFRENGYDCGSGPTESTCGAFTQRLKGSGMKWDRDNAQRMMNLESIHFSGQWDRYWQKERAA
jgi:hypothetical protein